MVLIQFFQKHFSPSLLLFQFKSTSDVRLLEKVLKGDQSNVAYFFYITDKFFNFLNIEKQYVTYKKGFPNDFLHHFPPFPTTSGVLRKLLKEMTKMLHFFLICTVKQY